MHPCCQPWLDAQLHALSAFSSAPNGCMRIDRRLLGLYHALHIQLRMHMCEDLRVALLVDMHAAFL